jgi:hypothetical protein
MKPGSGMRRVHSMVRTSLAAQAAHGKDGQIDLASLMAQLSS